MTLTWVISALLSLPRASSAACKAGVALSSSTWHIVCNSCATAAFLLASSSSAAKIC